MVNDLLRALPSVGSLLEDVRLSTLTERHGPGLVKWQTRQLLDDVRAMIRDGRRQAVPERDELLHAIGERVARLAEPGSRQAINGTGILLHTGLGRAPMSEAAGAAVAAATGCTPVQADPIEGTRSRREARVEAILRELTGCEAATVVNNNAAATMLVLHAVAAGREVVVSRGQLIEIGGSFRLPDVMAMSSCRLREVGCTNRTHLQDYRAAITDQTGALIHVHTSNFRVRGFASTPGIEELAELAHEHQLPAIDDLGSGALVPLHEWGLSDEPLVRDAIAAGADLCCFSGDKLIGGPQSGIICGRREWIDRIRADPFARMFRVCKLTLAGLEASLLHFLGGSWRRVIPFYRMLDRGLDLLRSQGEGVLAALAGSPCFEIELVETTAYVGSGSLPDESLPSLGLRLRHRNWDAQELARMMRACRPGIFPRIEDDRVLIDLRTVLPEDNDQLIAALRSLCRAES